MTWNFSRFTLGWACARGVFMPPNIPGAFSCPPHIPGAFSWPPNICLPYRIYQMNKKKINPPPSPVLSYPRPDPWFDPSPISENAPVYEYKNSVKWNPGNRSLSSVGNRGGGGNTLVIGPSVLSSPYYS